MYSNYHYNTYRKPSVLQTTLEDFRASTFTRQLVSLLTIDIAVGFLYAMVPTTFAPVRGVLALIQLGFMVATMAITIRRVLEDY